MVAAVNTDGHPEIEFIACVHDLARYSAFGQWHGAGFVADHPGARVTFEQRTDPVGVEMIVVDVGDEHTVQSGEPLKPG